MSLLDSMFFGLWVVGIVAFVALEVHTQAFYAIFVAVGSIAAAVVTLFNGGVWLQGALFGAVTLGGLLLLRPVLVRHFDNKVPITKILGIQGSADGLVGQTALTLDTVGDDHHFGHAQFANDSWLAVTADGEPIVANSRVVVVGVRGTTLLVSKAELARAV